MKNANFKSIRLFGSLISLAFLATACGNMATKNGDQLRTSNGYSQSGTSAYGSAAERCAASPNVSPLGYNSTMSQQYHACAGSSSTSSVQLFPADGTSKSVCVFPALAQSGSIQTYVVNPYAAPQNRYLYQCVTVQSSGSSINFSVSNFNAVYVVDANAVSILATCMAYGNISSCAAQSGISVSYGQFR